MCYEFEGDALKQLGVVPMDEWEREDLPLFDGSDRFELIVNSGAWALTDGYDDLAGCEDVRRSSDHGRLGNGDRRGGGDGGVTTAARGVFWPVAR